MTNFMAEGPGGGGERYNREGLIRWANDRFQASLPVEEVKNRPRNEIENLLKESSRRFFVNGELIEKTDEYLDQAYPDRTRTPQTDSVAERPSGRSQVLGRADPLGEGPVRTANRSRRAGASRLQRRPASACSTRTTRGIAPSCTRSNGP